MEADARREEIEGLERDITLLSRALSFPETPSLIAGVRSRIEAERVLRAPASAWKLALTGVAAAAVALAFVAGVLAPARDAMADIFDRINIFETEEVPAELPRDITGEEVTLAEAEQRMGQPIAMPAYPEGVEGALTRVLLQEFPDAELKVAVLFFEPKGYAPFALFETNGRVGKGLGPGATAETVEDLPGAYWLEGLRIVQFYDAAGNIIRESQRASETSTLVWTRGEFVFRLEGDLDREEAVEIAKSLR